jgi:hypothetical protein
MEISLKLTQEEVGFLMNVLGELPTKTGAWTLIQKVKDQVEPQLPPPQPKEENQ